MNKLWQGSFWFTFIHAMVHVLPVLSFVGLEVHSHHGHHGHGHGHEGEILHLVISLVIHVWMAWMVVQLENKSQELNRTRNFQLMM